MPSDENTRAMWTGEKIPLPPEGVPFRKLNIEFRKLPLEFDMENVLWFIETMTPEQYRAWFGEDKPDAV